MAKLSGNIENFTFAVQGANATFKLAKIEGAEGISSHFRVHAGAGVRRCGYRLRTDYRQSGRGEILSEQLRGSADCMRSAR